MSSIGIGVDRSSGVEHSAGVPSRLAALAYGAIAYASFLAVFVYLIGFMGNLLVPPGIDSARLGPLWAAILIDAGLLVLFALQHSVMARPTFKRWWTRFVPVPAERATYLLFSSAALGVLFWLWQPIGGVVWQVHEPIARGTLWTLFAAGWLLVFLATVQIGHFELFGLRQVWLYATGRPYSEPKFVEPWLYRRVRHPIYLGWMIAFWATPTMTAAHLVFAALMTVYMLIAIRLEERNLIEAHGRAYRDYRNRVPMLVPGLGRE